MTDDEKKKKIEDFTKTKKAKEDFTKTKKAKEDFEDPWDEDAIRKVAEKIIERITR